jgi:hypothetical protein
VFHVITSVWGEHHTRLFLDLTLPNVLSARNLPTLARQGEVIYRFFTTPTAREHIAASQMGKRLASIVTVEYVTPLGNRTPETIWHINWFHRAAAEAKVAGAIAVFVPPDTLWTDGSFARMGEHIAAGKRGVACPFIHVVSDTCVSEARETFVDRSGVLTIPPSKVWAFAHRHMHPLQALAMPGAPHARPMFEIHWADQNGMLSRYAFRELVAFDPRRCPHTFFWYPDGPEDLKDLHFGSDPFDMVMLSVDPLEKYLQNYILDHSCQPIDVARTTLHPLNNTQQTRLFISRSVRINSGAQNANLVRRQERSARLAVRDIRVGRAAMLVCSKLLEYGCERMADLLSVALLDTHLSRRWRAEPPLTVVATCDGALSTDDLNSLRSLMAPGCERQLVDVILDHVIVGRLIGGRPVRSLGGTLLLSEFGRTTTTINGVKVLHALKDLEGVEVYILDGIVANSLAAVTNASGYTSEPFIPGDGVNRVPEAENLEQVIQTSRIASFSVAANTVVRSYRVAATGGASEHYVALGGMVVEQGSYTLSLQVHPGGRSRIRLQLLDDKANGAMGDFDLLEGTVSAVRLGSATRASGSMVEATQDWRTITLTTTLMSSRASVIIQLLDSKGDSSFVPEDEAIEFRALQVERGQSATRYPLLTQ